MSKHPVVLIIRDGWGVNPGGEATAERDGNAVLLANTPFHDVLWKKYPLGLLSASGLDVGLPKGQMGNSEVGHLNLGAGRIVYQDLTRINKAFVEGTIQKNAVFQSTMEKAKKSRLHFIGLVSDGGVHSHQNHLIAMVKMAKESGVNDIMIHAITDGRDTSPKAGSEYLKLLEKGVTETGAKIATVIGRYYAMDRDKRWDRSKLAWDAIVDGIGEETSGSASDAVKLQYVSGQTDEFILPMIFTESKQRRIRDGDVVLWFNFRADRARQLSEPFVVKGFSNFETNGVPNVYFTTLTEYDVTYDCDVIFSPQSMNHVLGEVVSAAGKNQLRIAETEKYPHVSYFFNGGVEKPFEGEDRAVIPSPRDVATYDLKPEMSAPEVTQIVLEKISNYDLVILNFANPDMVGHTGIVEAGIKAVETIDHCVKLIVEKTLSLGGKLLITADHGNCEVMRNLDGSPNTAHTTNLVHIIYVAADSENYSLNNGILADVAPTLLEMLGIAQPLEMTGKSLLFKK
jgi:2,3-bisphosphoglycerate-independent phosphoglycerate mutase